MSQLVPCVGCGRHVRLDDDACPFCGGTARKAHARSIATGATRAAIFFLGASMAGASCDQGGGTVQPVYGGPPQPESIAQPYGAPPDPPEEPTPEEPEQAPEEPEGPQVPE